ncbi:hypothetical protein [Asaia sp. VD9]|uniref:hypothetical protein n=1 Tax=Asaia sp. VD9 TaxID=3081235 RepID=UPI00301AF4AE
MAEAGVIREFLVSLGWSVDRAGEQRFEQALKGAQTAALAVVGSLTGIVASVAKVAQSYEQLYYSSQRAQSSAQGMQAFAYAVGQMGGSAEAARGSLQAMGNFLRSNPGGESFIARLGVQTRDTHGELRDTADVMQDLAKQFQAEPYYQAKAQAGVLGIDENTLQAMRRGLGQFGNEYRDIYRRAGVDQNQAARSSATFMQQLRSLGLVFQALRDKVAISLERGVGGDIVRFRKLMLDNFDRITDIIVRATRFVLALGDALAQLFGRGVGILSDLWDHFNNLDQSTRTWIVTIGALGVAWRLLNRGFLATPLGRLLAIGGAIIALYDDYKTWKAGGTSLIDWAQWKPGIDAAMDALHQIGVLFDDMWPRAQRWLTPLVTFLRNELRTTFLQTVHLIGGVARALDDLLHRRFAAAWKDVKETRAALHEDAEDEAPGLQKMVRTYGSMVADKLGMPRGIRNNNPGNLVFVGQKDAHLEAGTADPRFAEFATPQAGLNAMADQLRLYMSRDHINTVKGIISKWAPSSDNNDTASYITSVANAMHVSATQALDPDNAGQLSELMHAITKRENGYDPYKDKEYQFALSRMDHVQPRVDERPKAPETTSIASAKPVTVTQTNHITVNGSHNPEQTGQSILRAQNQASANLVRNAKTRLM